jgi:hypothetical protein
MRRGDEQWESRRKERQLVGILCEWDHLGNNRLTIERHGVWDLALEQQGGKARVIRGTGPTFDEAWGQYGLGPDRLTGAERI